MKITERKLTKIEELVTYMLERYPCTRDNDKLLYLYICAKAGLDTKIPLNEFCKDDKYPSIESIGRCRRKIQSKREELIGNVKHGREIAEREVIKYAKRK